MRGSAGLFRACQPALHCHRHRRRDKRCRNCRRRRHCRRSDRREMRQLWDSQKLVSRNRKSRFRTLRWGAVRGESVPQSSLRQFVHRFSGLGFDGRSKSANRGALVERRWYRAFLSHLLRQSDRQVAHGRLYSHFVRKDDLVFDIGSHVGNRIGSFRRLGCRVIAVEPQPSLVRILRLFYGRDPEVVIAPLAVAAAPGCIELFVNRHNPGLTAASSGFLAAASATPG